MPTHESSQQPVLPAGSTRPSRDFFGVIGKVFDQRLVPFLIPDVHKDIRMGVYITVARSRYYSGPAQAHVRAWYGTVTKYFATVRTEITKWVEHQDQLALKRLHAMLAIEEPAEVRLGYAVDGSKGRAFRKSRLRDDLLRWMLEKPELLNGCTVEPDLLSMAPSFALDRVSDLMVNVGKAHVIEFTTVIADMYGFDPRCMVDDVKVGGVWDPTTLQFKEREARLPVDDEGRAILLVPSDMVRSGSPLRVQQFFADFPEDRPPEKLTKRALLDAAARHPGRLGTFAIDRLKDPDKYKSRRNLRPAPERRSKRSSQ